MSIYMCGINYNLAPIEVREQFAFTKTALESAYDTICSDSDVLGAVIISTCNRTELYISCEDDACADPFGLLCTSLGVSNQQFAHLNQPLQGGEAMAHLCALACGVKSQIWGEDQIITQVKNAVATAREIRAVNPELEVMFRSAITAAKKARSTINLCQRESSVVTQALDVIKASCNIKDVLVIGNGEIGRLVTQRLLENGYNVTMTLRQYRHGLNIVPLGAYTVNYSDRYTALASCDAVVSATLSPHHTLEYSQIVKMNPLPTCFIDLAVPRDIDPAIEAIPNIQVYNVDTIGAEKASQNHTKKLEQIEQIVAKYIQDFDKWCAFKKGLATYDDNGCGNWPRKQHVYDTASKNSY